MGQSAVRVNEDLVRLFTQTRIEHIMYVYIGRESLFGDLLLPARPLPAH